MLEKAHISNLRNLFEDLTVEDPEYEKLKKMSDFENISFDFLQDKIREELHPTSGPGHEQKMLDINKKRLNNI